MKENRSVRAASVAGSFYEKNPELLRKQLQKLFSIARPVVCRKPVAALLVPHAGYVFSGVVAASAFNQIPAGQVYQRIFLIGSSHRMAFNGASVFVEGDYSTPLGRVPVDTNLGESLVVSSFCFTSDPTPHLLEHSLEVQLPFLQFHLKHPFLLVPIVMGTDDPQVCAQVANALKPWFGPESLFVISTDFSHYPAYDDACVVDEHTLAAILENDPLRLLEVLSDNKRRQIPGLVTSLCGWTSVLTLLFLTHEDSALSFRQVDYENSGDSLLGSRDRVVGYQAVAVVRDKAVMERNRVSFTSGEKSWLLRRARQSLEAAVRHQLPDEPQGGVPPALTLPAGVFVSLYSERALRGCIGSFEADRPLWQMVDRMTAFSAMKDSRFLPVSPAEIEKVVIELSVLTPKRKVEDISEIVLGIHGIVVKKEGRVGTFLPQVATKYQWSREEFLGHCARDKAHIGWDGWREASVYVFEALVFREIID